MPQGLQQGETLEPLSGFPPPSAQSAAGASYPSLREGETLEPVAKPTNSGAGGSWEQPGPDTGFVHGVMRGGRNIIHAAKEIGTNLANPNMPVALSDRPEDQGSVATRLQGDTMLNKYILAPAAQEKQRSLEEAEAMHRTHGLESLGHGITSMIHTAGEYVPVAGPVVGSLVDRARQGDISGAIGEGTTYAVAPRIARGVGGRAIAAARDIPGLRTVVPSVEGVGTTIGRSRVGPLLTRGLGASTPAEPPVEGEVLPPESPAIRRVPGDIPPVMIRPRVYSPYAPAEPIPPRTGLALPSGPEPMVPAAVPPASASIAVPEPMQPAAAQLLQPPVTENPVVGSLVRAMQKSGVPIAKRPNLLLKGSGRVNRMLGPEEDLTDILGKSLRQARRQREQ